MRKIILVSFFILFTACGYSPINKNNISKELNLKVLKMNGDETINKLIKRQLELHSNKIAKDIFNINIDTNYQKLVLSKDAKGTILDYQIFLTANFRVNYKNQTKDYNFNESINMKNISDSMEKQSYENNIKNNFASSLKSKLIKKLLEIK